VRLELMSAKGYLGCPNRICDLGVCSLTNYNNFGVCGKEGFQIIGEGGGSIKSGQRVRFRYTNEHNRWLGCPYNRCDKRPCPGSINSANARNFDTCWGEVFKIYACGRHDQDQIQNGDLVMIYFEDERSIMKGFISIQGSSEGADTSISVCPGNNPPPASLSYSFCSRNVFRIHRKP